MFKKLFKFVTVGFVTFSALVTVVACNNISSDKQKIIADKKDETKEPDENKKTLTEQYENFANEIFNEILNTFDKQELYDQDNNKEITKYQMDITPNWNNSDKKIDFWGEFRIYSNNKNEWMWDDIGGKDYFYKNNRIKNKESYYYLQLLENPFYKSISQKIKNITYQNWVKYFSHSISRTSHKLAFFKKKLNGFLILIFSINKFDNADSNIPQEKFLEGKFPLEWHTLNKVELQVTLSYLGISEKIVTKDDIYAIRSNEFKNEDNIYGYGYYIRDFFTKNIENVKFMWDTTNCEWCFNY